MEFLMNECYSACLCDRSASREIISFKNILQNFIETRNFATIIYHPLWERTTADITETNDTHYDNLILLQILIEEVYLRRKLSTEKVCGESLQLLSFILKNDNFFENIKKAMFVENCFLQYTAAKLLSATILSLPEDKANDYLVKLSFDLKSEKSEKNIITVMTVFQKILQFSLNNSHHFSKYDEKIRKTSQNFQNHCKHQVEPPVVNVNFVQNCACQTLVNDLPGLIQNIEDFRLYLKCEDVNWFISNEMEYYSDFSSEEHCSIELKHTDLKCQLISEIYLHSVLCLWQSFAENLKENCLLEKWCNIYQKQNCWNWSALLTVISNSPSSVAILLLNILNDSLPYWTKQSAFHLEMNVSLPLSILQTTQEGYLLLVSHKDSFVWSFGGMIESDSKDVTARFCGNPILQKYIFLLLKSLAVLKDHCEIMELWGRSLDTLSCILEEWKLNWIVHFFSDQDDNLVEALLYAIDIYLVLPNNMKEQYDYFLNPNSLFEYFATSIQFDHQIILDYLTSNETNFLLYFLQYLKFLNAYLIQKNSLLNFHSSIPVTFQSPSIAMKKMKLVDYSDSESEDDLQISDIEYENEKLENYHKYLNNLEGILSLCDKLRSSISKLQQKNLFPFNPQPLLRLLNSCCQYIK